jgi:hypothetical protein
LINFRYHIVSLVAVFLALGMGVLAASSFINNAVVDGLQERQETQKGQIRNLQNDVLRLEKSNTNLEEFLVAVRPEVLRERLRDRRLLILGFETTPESTFDAVVEAFRGTRVQIEGIFVLSERLDLGSAAARQQVALAVESPADSARVTQPLLVKKLGEALTGKPPGFLQRLIDQGLARSRPVDGVTFRSPEDLAASDTATAILSPGGQSKLANPELLLHPLARGLSTAETRFVIGETGESELKTLPPMRQDSALRGATVDGVDKTLGQISLVLALEAALRGEFGHYGTGENAVSLMPQITPSSATATR